MSYAYCVSEINAVVFRRNCCRAVVLSNDCPSLANDASVVRIANIVRGQLEYELQATSFRQPKQVMHSRRNFLLQAALSTLAIAGFPYVAASARPMDSLSFKGKDVFDRILSKSREGHWGSLSIGELAGRIARELEGTPYEGLTLELSPDREICSVNLTALDCVTFFEDVLCLARMVKKGEHSPAALLKEIALTRYRGGVVGDYTTRLHYTTDWFFDNETKGTVKILSDLPGAEPFTQKVGFMSANPGSYKQLAAHPDLIPKMKRIEDDINSRSLSFIPINKLAAVEPLLKTGDIVAVCTSSPPGIDIVHTGLVYREVDGVAHFMDASSSKAKMKVTLEPGPVSGALNWSKNLTGAMFARPLEPKK